MEEELRDMKAHKEYYRKLDFVANAQHGIPQLCPCGSITKLVVDEEDSYDYLPGKRYFICKDFENDGLHFRQPWVMGMQEEVERLKLKVYEQEKLIRECMGLKEQVRMLNRRLSELDRNVVSQRTDDSSVKERRKWTQREDKILIGAWLNTSKDPVVSNDQKAGAFWKRIVEYYNSSPLLVGTVPRELGQCKARWARINELVCKFAGCYDVVLREQRSGRSDNDVMSEALTIFSNDNKGVRFGLEHAWRALRYDVKWCSLYLDKGGKEKRRPGDSEAEGSVTEPEGRPIGVKAAKAGGKRKKFGKEEELAKLNMLLETKKQISDASLLQSLISKPEPLTEMEMTLKMKLMSQMI